MQFPPAPANTSSPARGEQQGLWGQERHFQARKEMGLSICPKIEGVEPLSTFPVLLEEAGRLSQSMREMDF